MRPARRAVERDDEAIERWANERWPKVQKPGRQGRLDRLPRREWVQSHPLGEIHLGAPGPYAGAPPPLLHWKRLSMSAAVCLRPDGSDGALVFGLTPGAYNDELLMEFLTGLHRHLDSDKVTLILGRTPLAPQQGDEALRRLAALLAGRRAAPARPTAMTSTPSNRCGAVSRAGSSPTCAQKPSRKPPSAPTRDFPGSATTPGCASPSFVTAGSSCDRSTRYFTNIF